MSLHRIDEYDILFRSFAVRLRTRNKEIGGPLLVNRSCLERPCFFVPLVTNTLNVNDYDPSVT